MMMYKRTETLALLVLIVLLAAGLMPLAQLMKESCDHAIDEEQQVIMDTLLAHEAHMKEAPGAPVIPMIDIEEAWAIEDGRQESETPLVHTMKNGADELGYDEEWRTFYCTLGLEHSDAWPEIALTAKGAQGLQVAWIDDYTYDWCADAIVEGYAYELIAYTDTAYEYIYVVFTGLPIVTLHTGQEIGETYIPSRTTIAGAGYEAVDSATLVHTRSGGFYKGIDKFSYRIEFHGVSQTGKEGKTPVSLLGMEADTDWLLLSNAQDETAIRNELCWDMWRMWNEGKENYNVLDTRLVEVFVEDEYKGIYQLCQRIDVEEELTRMDGNLSTDYVVRIIRPARDTGRPVEDHMEEFTVAYELRHAPKNQFNVGAFDMMHAYEAMNYLDASYTDEEFTAIAQEWLDVEHLMDYYLFAQACSLGGDNVFNNLYIWIQKEEDGQYVYRISPWDMDRSFNTKVDGVTQDDLDLQMMMTYRLLSMDALGSRTALHEIFDEKRATILSDDFLYQWIEEMETTINASGAYLRESEKWRGGAQPLNLTAVSAGTITHMSTIEYYLKELWPRNDL